MPFQQLLRYMGRCGPVRNLRLGSCIGRASFLPWLLKTMSAGLCTIDGTNLIILGGMQSYFVTNPKVRVPTENTLAVITFHCTTPPSSRLSHVRLRRWLCPVQILGTSPRSACEGTAAGMARNARHGTLRSPYKPKTPCLLLL